MRFQFDEDVYGLTVRLVSEWGHETLTAVSVVGASSDDESLLKFAHEQQLILVTRDRDFGALVFLSGFATGVIYLRMLPSTQQATHQQLQNVLETYSEETLQNAFVVVEPGRHRFRSLSR